MWGENWGELIWGGALARQVPIGPWALLMLGALLGICAVKGKSHLAARIIPVVVIVMLPVIAMGTAPLITFVNGTIADAEEVNANFEALRDEIEAQSGLPYEASVSIRAGGGAVYTALERESLTRLCGDFGGCTVRLCTISAPTRICGDPSFLFYGAEGDLWQRQTDLGAAFPNLVAGDDGDADPETVFVMPFTQNVCRLTDADFLFPGGQLADTGQGFGLYAEAANAVTCGIVVND